MAVKKSSKILLQYFTDSCEERQPQWVNDEDLNQMWLFTQTIRLWFNSHTHFPSPKNTANHTETHSHFCAKNQAKHVGNTQCERTLNANAHFELDAWKMYSWKWVQKSAQETHSKTTIEWRKRSNSPNWAPYALVEMITWLHICFHYVIY